MMYSSTDERDGRSRECIHLNTSDPLLSPEHAGGFDSPWGNSESAPAGVLNDPRASGDLKVLSTGLAESVC